MISKSLFLVYIQVILIQNIRAQCIGAYGAPRAAPIPAAPYGEIIPFLPATLAASKGGNFAINSVSPIVPTGVFVTSENAFEGPVKVLGKVPFLGGVALEGSLPTLGAGIISYGCGNGNVAITNEGVVGPGYGISEPYGYGSYGYGGCGYGKLV